MHPLRAKSFTVLGLRSRRRRRRNMRSQKQRGCRLSLKPSAGREGAQDEEHIIVFMDTLGLFWAFTERPMGK